MGGDLLLHGQPVERRQAQVEHDEIGGVIVEMPQGRDAVARFLDVVPLQLKRQAPHPTQVGIVLDDQNGLLLTHFFAVVLPF